MPLISGKAGMTTQNGFRTWQEYERATLIQWFPLANYLFGAQDLAGFQASQYSIDSNGELEMRGVIEFTVGNVGAGASTTIANLPAGLSPTAREMFAQFCGNLTVATQEPCRVDIEPSGVVLFVAPSIAGLTAPFYITLSGIHYYPAPI